MGPGLMAMLADTDAGSVVTAAQSGARFGYRFLLLQLVLVPFIYSAQETAARLGLVTGKGQGELIREHFGRPGALLTSAVLWSTCMGALMTEFAGVAGAGELAGIPRAVSATGAVVALTALVLAGGYRHVERIGIAVGLLELAFLPAAFLARPDAGAVADGLLHPGAPVPGYLTLLAANVGSAVIPWMLVYQQTAVVEKGRGGLGLERALSSARADTLVGALLCQVVTAAIITSTAATVGSTSPGAALDSIGQIAQALAPALGPRAAAVLFGAGMAGASLSAALVISLAGAWGLSEALGWRHSLKDPLRQAGKFYTLLTGADAVAAASVVLAPNLIDLTVAVQVMNACLLPIVLAFQLVLERRALAARWRTHGARRAVALVLHATLIAFGLITAVGLIGGGPT
ncbi:NRAMP family divalent metal transporter [Sinomonas atrocyanea]